MSYHNGGIWYMLARFWLLYPHKILLTMKRIFTLIVLIIFSVSFSHAQNIDDVVAALRSANAAQVAKYFDNTVEMALPGKSNNFSKAQAEVVLKDFLANNPVKDIVAIHKGENSGNQYYIGTLVTKTGNYRTTIYMKQRGDAQVLQELKFVR
jgi:Domain of unknown function (DUF4783)